MLLEKLVFASLTLSALPKLLSRAPEQETFKFSC